MDTFTEFTRRFIRARLVLRPFALRLKLRGLRIARSQSEETLAYTTSLYFDGRKIGSCRNSGTGGSSCATISDPEVRRDIDMQIRAILSASEDVHGSYDLENLIDDLVMEEDARSWFRTWSKRKVQAGKVAFLVDACEDLAYAIRLRGEAVDGLLAEDHANTIRKRGHRIVEIAGHPNYLLRIAQ